MNIFAYFKKKGIDTVDPSFYRKIDEWQSWYSSNVRRFHFYRVYNGKGYCRCRRRSLGMAKKVCEDIANLLLNERVKFTVGDTDPQDEAGRVTDASANATYDFLTSVLEENRFWKLGNEFQERKAALGTVAYVPYIADASVDAEGRISGGDVKINYIKAGNIFPITWENGRVIEAAFIFPKICQGKKYVQVAFHRLESTRAEDGSVRKEYVIENSVVECGIGSGSGAEIEPSRWKEIPAFMDLAERIETGSDRPQFVIDTLNIANNLDQNDEDTANPMGISIFANAVDALATADLQYDSYGSEFDLGRKRIFVAPELLSMGPDGNPTFDPNDTVFYQLPEDYFSKTNEAIHEVNMDLRVEPHSKAISDSLNYISMKCGFGQDHYKFEAGQVKTATEVISANSELFRTLVKHELVLDHVLRELFRIIIRLGAATGVPNISDELPIRIAFDDSIIEDKAAERQQDRQDVSMGAMSLAEYRAKWYGETESDAAERLPDQTGGVMP